MTRAQLKDKSISKEKSPPKKSETKPKRRVEPPQPRETRSKSQTPPEKGSKAEELAPQKLQPMAPSPPKRDVKAAEKLQEKEKKKPSPAKKNQQIKPMKRSETTRSQSKLTDSTKLATRRSLTVVGKAISILRKEKDTNSKLKVAVKSKVIKKSSPKKLIKSPTKPRSPAKKPVVSPKKAAPRKIMDKKKALGKKLEEKKKDSGKVLLGKRASRTATKSR